MPTFRGGSADLMEETARETVFGDGPSIITPAMDDEDEIVRTATLPDFEQQLKTYCNYRDSLESLPDYTDVGWIRINLQPMKQLLITLARKWMWTFAKYLIDQVTTMLVDLDLFLKRTEPDLESITGEERDTASFMRMMRLFNEVNLYCTLIRLYILFNEANFDSMFMI